MKHLIDPTDLSVAEINDILDLAQDIIEHKEEYSEVCKGKNLRLYFLNQVQEPVSALRLQ